MLQGATVRCKAVKALKAVVQASRSVLALEEVQDGVSHALQAGYDPAEHTWTPVALALLLLLYTIAKVCILAT